MRPPRSRRRKGQKQQRARKQAKMREGLPPRRQPTAGDVGVVVASKQRALKKDQACCPYRSRSSKPGENHFREHWLDQEQKERTEGNRRGTENSVSSSLL